MLKKLAVLFIFFLFSNAEVLLPNKNFKINQEELHKKQAENIDIDIFHHTKQFFDTVHSSKKVFKSEIIKNVLNNDSYIGISSEVYHNTTTIGKLFDNAYFSLDDSHIEVNIINIDYDFIIDCNNYSVSVDDYYVGTSESKHKDIKSNSNNNAKKGFIFSRQVINVEPVYINNIQCNNVTTVIVHPLLIMDTQITSSIQFPYSKVIIPTRKLSEASNSFAKPDPPLLKCTDEKILSKQGSINKAGSGTFKVSGVPINYEYALDLHGNECLYADATVPGSINFNYASGTNAIKQNIVLGNGLTCTNCYSFIGASLLTVINIFGGKLSTFAFEAKNAGGAGFNIAILANNPMYSGSKYISLAGPGKTTSVPITLGLSLDINFGGAWATVKGSGSAKGQASFSSGYTLMEEDSIIYSKSAWRAKHSLTNSKQLKPKYTNNGLKLSTSSLSILVSVSARINYKLGGSIPVVNVGASVDFSSVLTATAQYFKPGSSYLLELTTMDEDNKGNRRLYSNERKYNSGDVIKFNVKYRGLNPNEEHELYFNIHKGEGSDRGAGYPITMDKFKSSKSGEGHRIVNWKIPRDTKYTQRYNETARVKFSVHSSAQLNRYYTKTYFHLTRSRNEKSSNVFEFPKENAIICTQEPTNVRWDKNSLKYFNYHQGTDGLGVEKVPEKINIIIVAFNEKDKGIAFRLADNVTNTGYHNINFPEELTKYGLRFKLVLHDSKDYSRMAWHNGTFKIVYRPKILRHRIPSVKIKENVTGLLQQVYIESPTVENDMYLWEESVRSNYKQLQIYDRRILTSQSKCPNAVLSLMLQLELGFDGFTLLGKEFTLGSTRSNPFVLIPQTNICI
jgi:hypothetical protein